MMGVEGGTCQLDLFSPWGNPESYRDLIDAMAYPLVSPSKNRDVRKPIHYEGKHVTVTVSGNVLYRIATIWDWDLIIGFVSMLNDARKKGRKVSRRIRFRPFDLLDCIKRSKGGANYHELAAAIRRLRFTAINTNIRVDDQHGVEQGFTILDHFVIPDLYGPGAKTGKGAHEEKPDPNREWDVVLSSWIYKAVICDKPQIKLIPPEYFSLRGATERFIYLLAHKAIPERQFDFPLYMDTLYRLSGSCGRPYDFRKKIHEIERKDNLPDYRIVIKGEGPGAMVHLCRKQSFSNIEADDLLAQRRAEALFGPSKSTQEILNDEVPY